MKTRHVYAVRDRPHLDAALRAVRACGVGGGAHTLGAPPPQHQGGAPHPQPPPPRPLPLHFYLGPTPVLGHFRSVGCGLFANFFGFVVEVFLVHHLIYLVRACAVKSTMGTTRA